LSWNTEEEQVLMGQREVERKKTLRWRALYDEAQVRFQ
jgi:hypothetical protein